MLLNRPGLRTVKAKVELLGRRPRDWRTYISLCAPHLPDAGEIISLNDQYFVSIGVHATHQALLMERSAAEPLTVEKSMNAAALVAFTIDSPVIPEHTEDQVSHQSPNFREVRQRLRAAGLRLTKDYFEALSLVAQAACNLDELGTRGPVILMRYIPYPGRNRWLYLSWPRSPATWRALTAYWSGLLSLPFPGRLLNFWRAVEAVTSKADRYALFEDLENCRVRPVLTRVTTRHRGEICEVVRNASKSLRRLAVSRRNQLVAAHTTVKEACDWLYYERRGKAAHADRISLDFDGLASMDEQLSDALLCQYMARVAIERYWR